jgi:pyruvate, water dikinase
MSKQIFFGEEEATKLYRFVKKHAQVAVDEKMQRGITASPGKVTGRARIVLSPADNHKVKPGDILITTATTVDYLPAMKRAAAFVAEVGGLTCHAAVVAREFGVPCIVSLKNVTKKFKDGDLVELDANKGLVKKV